MLIIYPDGKVILLKDTAYPYLKKSLVHVGK